MKQNITKYYIFIDKMVNTSNSYIQQSPKLFHLYCLITQIQYAKGAFKKCQNVPKAYKHVIIIKKIWGKRENGTKRGIPKQGKKID